MNAPDFNSPTVREKIHDTQRGDYSCRYGSRSELTPYLDVN